MLWLAVAANLGLLGYFKYYNFFVASLINASDAAGLKVDIGFIELPLPVAISFFTFHALSYIIDVYRRVLKPTTSLLDILFYISFFPHLIAGPIVRANKFLAQTVGPRDPANIRLGQSVFLILGGLFKKVIIANYLSTGFVDGVFRDPTASSSLDLILGMYTYALQIYCDFSAPIPTSPSGSPTCSATSFRRTSIIRTAPSRCRISGGAGTCRCRAGCAIIFISRSAAANTARSRPTATS